MKDITGQRFGRLVALKPAYKKNRRWYWLSKCDCGKEKIINGGHIGREINSCGCLIKDVSKYKKYKTHQQSYTRLYRIWSGVKQRCLNPKASKYEHYGGRGITLCDEWKKDFKNFSIWAKEKGYHDKLTIDRIDVNGNYEPNNCRWITQQEQCENTRRNKKITYKGKTQNLKAWCRELDLNYNTIRSRFEKEKSSIEKLFRKIKKLG